MSGFEIRKSKNFDDMQVVLEMIELRETDTARAMPKADQCVPTHAARWSRQAFEARKTLQPDLLRHQVDSRRKRLAGIQRESKSLRLWNWADIVLRISYLYVWLKACNPKIPLTLERLVEHEPLQSFCWKLKLCHLSIAVGRLDHLRSSWLHQQPISKFTHVKNEACLAMWDPSLWILRSVACCRGFAAV